MARPNFDYSKLAMVRGDSQKVTAIAKRDQHEIPVQTDHMTAVIDRAKDQLERMLGRQLDGDTWWLPRKLQVNRCNDMAEIASAIAHVISNECRNIREQVETAKLLSLADMELQEKILVMLHEQNRRNYEIESGTLKIQQMELTNKKLAVDLSIAEASVPSPEVLRAKQETELLAAQTQAQMLQEQLAFMQFENKKRREAMENIQTEETELPNYED